MTQIIDLGKLRFSFAGEWNASTTYETNDVVKYGGNVYVYTYGLKTSTQLPTNTVYWALMVEGIKFKGVFSGATAYKVGDAIAHGGKVYIAVADTTGNTPPNLTYWSQFADGIQYEGDYSGTAQYQKNDLVKYGSSAYIAKQDTTGNLPVNETFWAKLVEGISAAGAWSAATAYVPNDLVAYGANQYKAIANSTNQLPTNASGVLNSAFWALQTEGIRSRGEWVTATEYYINDVVSRGGNSYICVVRNAATTFETDLAAAKWIKFNSGVRWRGVWATGVSYLKDDIVKDAVGSAYIATQDHTASATFPADSTTGKWAVFVLGGADVLPAIQATDVGQSLTVKADGSGIEWIGTTQSDKVFYVASHGTDTPTAGRNITSPFASIKYATTQCGEGATIFVKTGTYLEQLPITIPANTAIVGDSQRTVFVEPKAGLSDDGVTPNNQASMFLMSNASILNRMTFKGMTGWVPGTTPSDITTSVIKGVVVRLNPASPITHKSPYVLECSFIGAGAIGALVDGSVHTTGNKSIIFHAYTVISDNGVGYWIKDGGKSEIVSCFTYFAYFGYTASGGGFIRALNGNNSYGTWGATARGFDSAESAITGVIVGEQLPFTYGGGLINVGDTVSNGAGATAIVTNVQYSSDKVYIKNRVGTFAGAQALTFTSGGTGTTKGAAEAQRGFVLVANGFSQLPKPGASISLAGDSFAYVVQSTTNTWVNSSSDIVLLLSQEKPSGSASGTGITIRYKYSQIRLTGHDFLSIGTGGTATTNYPGTPTQPAAQGNEVDEAFPGRVYYVSTDQDGNFRVGEYFRIDQATGKATLNASAFDLSGLSSLRLGSIGAQLGEQINEFSSDATMGGNSNLAVPTEFAVKAYVDTTLAARVPQAVPTSVGQTGKYLASLGNSVSWQTLESLPAQGFANGEVLFTDGVTPYWDGFTQVSGQNTFSFVNGASFSNTTYTATSQVNASPTFTWSVDVASLPPGITGVAINSSGVLSMTGTFTTNGLYNFTVNAVDNRGVIGRLLVRVVVAATSVIPVFNTTSSTTASTFAPGSGAVTVTNFQATNTGGGIVYAVSGGYPSWLTFNTTTGAFTGSVPALGSAARLYNLTVSATAGGITVSKTFMWTFSVVQPQGQALFGTNVGTGTFSWTAPAGVTSVNVVAVGGGGSSGTGSSSYGTGSGGGLGYKNNIPVVPGTAYTVQVGHGGTNRSYGSGGLIGGNSFFINTSTVAGYGGGHFSAGSTGGPNANGVGGGWFGDGGGAGGNVSGAYQGAGGGAGGYAGNGANPGGNNAPSGGGGGSGSNYSSTYGYSSGGGVGLLGQGPSGLSGLTSSTPSGGGPGGAGGPGSWNGPGGGQANFNTISFTSNATAATNVGRGCRGMVGENPYTSTGENGNSQLQGGTYGGGGGGAGDGWPNSAGFGGQGGVRIIWGSGRAFPATNTEDVIPQG